MDITIDLAESLPSHPFGRYHPADGDSTGEYFREYILKGALNELQCDARLIIDFTGLKMAVSSAFLSEAFYGCVKLGYVDATTLGSSIVIVDNTRMKEIYESSIASFIKQAECDLQN